ncbi:MAG TPA: M1 family aminopeptidase [Thermoanaerobaculia bacterium]|nr:M1 family aminopeptidase [Thermoanaerobaculia bacterium]
MRRPALTLVFAALLLPAPAFPARCADRLPAPETPKLRLPSGVAPLGYAAELWIDPSQDTFRGRIEIRISLKGETGTLWLNGKELTVESASAAAVDGPKDTLPAEASAAGMDFVRIHFQRNLQPGEYAVTLAYKGRVELKDTEGLFRQREGRDWYVFSQFESIFARRAFPCFDEPGFKVPWQLTLHVPKNLVAVSNTPVLSESDEAGGTKKVVFERTKPLPSYLIALGVGPFDIVPAGTAGRNRVPIRMIVPKGRGAETRWAVASTGPILDLLEAYFDIPYPYAKLDHLVIPQTVGFGAMENPGLVTYVSTSILSKPADETIRFRRRYASVCAHETAHQWFGDLVTMAWWDDVWLNESFATWMANKIVARWKPDWGTRVTRVETRSLAMDLDSLVTARRIRQPIESNDDIENAFDGITYQKGGAVLDMFESWTGEETFRKGVHEYLKAHAHGNATAADFVGSIASAAKNPEVDAAFYSFLDQPGVPLVTAELACSGGPPRLLLSQKRFLPTGSSGSARETWRIPVCARTGEPGATPACTLLTEVNGALPLAGSCPERVVANAASMGYYRVLYKGSMLGRILADSGKHLSTAERVGVLTDVAALARTGDVPMAAALALVPALAGDPDRQVVEAAVRIAVSPRDVFVTDELRPNYRRFLADTFGARARALGFRSKPGESEDTKLLRSAVVGLVAEEADDPALVAEATSLARKWLTDRSAIEPEMLATVLTAAARHGDAELFTAFVAEAKASSDRRERGRILAALGAFRDPSVEKLALNLTLSPDFDARESLVVLREAAADRETREGVWTFVKANFAALAARLPRESPAGFPQLAAGFSDEAHRREVATFFKDKAANYAGGPRRLAQSLEQIQLKTALRASQQESVASFLRSYQPRPTIDLKPRAGM